MRQVGRRVPELLFERADHAELIVHDRRVLLGQRRARFFIPQRRDLFVGGAQELLHSIALTREALNLDHRRLRRVFELLTRLAFEFQRIFRGFARAFLPRESRPKVCEFGDGFVEAAFLRLRRRRRLSLGGDEPLALLRQGPFGRLGAFLVLGRLAQHLLRLLQPLSRPAEARLQSRDATLLLRALSLELGDSLGLLPGRAFEFASRGFQRSLLRVPRSLGLGLSLGHRLVAALGFGDLRLEPRGCGGVRRRGARRLLGLRGGQRGGRLASRRLERLRELLDSRLVAGFLIRERSGKLQKLLRRGVSCPLRLLRSSLQLPDPSIRVLLIPPRVLRRARELGDFRLCLCQSGAHAGQLLLRPLVLLLEFLAPDRLRGGVGAQVRQHLALLARQVAGARPGVDDVHPGVHLDGLGGAHKVQRRVRLLRVARGGRHRGDDGGPPRPRQRGLQDPRELAVAVGHVRRVLGAVLRVLRQPLHAQAKREQRLIDGGSLLLRRLGRVLRRAFAARQVHHVQRGHRRGPRAGIALDQRRGRHLDAQHGVRSRRDVVHGGSANLPPLQPRRHHVVDLLARSHDAFLEVQHLRQAVVAVDELDVRSVPVGIAREQVANLLVVDLHVGAPNVVPSRVLVRADRVEDVPERQRHDPRVGIAAGHGVRLTGRRLAVRHDGAVHAPEHGSHHGLRG